MGERRIKTNLLEETKKGEVVWKEKVIFYWLWVKFFQKSKNTFLIVIKLLETQQKKLNQLVDYDLQPDKTKYRYRQPG